MLLPYKLQKHVLNYIDPNDKIYASMVCQLWKDILEVEFMRSDMIPNCAYNLSKCMYHDEDRVFINFEERGHRNYIYYEYMDSGFDIICKHKVDNQDVNTLNFLVQVLMDGKMEHSMGYYSIENLLTNYITIKYTKDKYVKYLLQEFDMYEMYIFMNMNKSLNNKSFQIAEHFLMMGGSCANWLDKLKWKKIKTKEKFNDTIDILKFLITHEAIYVPYLYVHINSKKKFKYKNKFIKFVKKYLSKDNKIYINEVCL